MNQIDRRKFLEFLGKSTALAGLTACAAPVTQTIETNNTQKKSDSNDKTIDLNGPSNVDDFLTVQGVGWYPLISWGEMINAHDKFGFNNDFTTYIPLNGSEEGLLWVNHEYPNSLFLHGETDINKKTEEQVLIEKKSVGASILHVKKNHQTNQYEVVKKSEYNKRINASTHIPFDHKHKLFGKDYAVGTFANCGGGVTPWGTVLTCEENFELFFGDWDFAKNERIPSEYGWEKHFNYSPLHYGWVVEVNPKTLEAVKRISLGRFSHESATVSKAKNGKIVVYMGDDTNNEHLYKFISNSDDSLEQGTLYVAQIDKGEWIALDLEKSPKLKEKFDSQVEVMIRAREAAKVVGATEMNRPEDIEIQPNTGHIFISLTKNHSKGDAFGSILKIVEDNNDHGSLTFKASTFLMGGISGIACPDNLAFDKKGNLWVTNDMSGAELNQGKYSEFKNNGLFFIPLSGPNSGKPFQVASAPVDAELTGPSFTPDGKTMFLSVQHPGETTKNIFKCTSRWPSYSETGIPKPTVVCLYGKYFNS